MDIINRGSNSLARFITSKKYWGPKTTKLQLYTLLRLAKHIDEPYRSKAQKCIAGLCKRHGFAIPKPPSPLIIPFLANTSFKKDLQTSLGQHIQNHRAQLLPLHWPSITLVEGKHKQLGDCVFSYKQWHTIFLVQPPETCECQQFLQLHPNAPQVNNHIAGGMSLVGFQSPLSEIASASAKDSFYAAKQKYTEQITRQFEKWSSRNNHAPLPRIPRLVHQLWPEHLKAVQLEQKYTFKDVTRLKNEVKDFVVHCQDHAPAKFCIYCPMGYYNANKKVFGDPEIFGKLDLPPSAVQATMKRRIPTNLLQSYPWGFNFDKCLPSSYLLLKEKKLYQKGRPIISYADTICADFFSMIGKLLTDLLPKTYPDTFGHLNIQQVFQKIHEYLNDGSEVEHSEFHNDDLVGFYVSVPHDRALWRQSRTSSSHI
jgi:hypothetical protein